MRYQATKQIYTPVVSIWITLSLASVVLAAVTWFQLLNRLAASAEAVALHDTVDATLKLVIDTESAQRGYTITGNESLLKALKRSEIELPTHFERLAELSRRDPELLNKVLDLRAQVETTLVFHRKVVAARNDEGFEAAAAMVRTEEGAKLMGRLRAIVDEIGSLRSELRSPEGRAVRGQLVRASLTSLVAAALGIGAGLLALYLAHVSSRQLQRERELLEAKLKAERESQEKTTFLADMSHEIRTPMNAIMGFCEVLSDEVSDLKHREYLRSIRTSATSLLGIINDILDLSKIEAGVLELRPEPTDPREVCDFIVMLFKKAAAKKGVTLECKVAEDLPRAILIDRVRLRQIVVNLVSNAVKFTDRGSITSSVDWEKQKEISRITLIIEVQDTGVGIPKDKLDAIFKPFFQAGVHHDKEKQGTGLGLSIVKSYTRAMGGTVTVASVVGQGSAFSVRFPDVEISARLPAEETAPTGVTVFNQLRPAMILIVDDNEQNCQLLAAMFQGSHHRLEFAGDGRQGVDKARTLHPDVVLLDIRMPVLDGFAALKKIRETPGLELLPVVAITAAVLAAEEKRAGDKFNGYLRKPFSRHELFDELAHFLPRDEGGAAAMSPPPAPTQAPAHNWRGLATQLRELEAQEWPAVRDNLAVNEARAFAAKLHSLARKGDCGPLLTYAEALAHYAETYAADALEKHLQDFPAMIATIERNGL